VINAFKVGFKRCIRARHAAVSSFGETFFVRTSSLASHSVAVGRSMGGASVGVAWMDEGIAAAAQAPPAILRNVRRLQSVFSIVMTDQSEVKYGGPGHDEIGIQSAQQVLK
jgi:hypothetical protein